MKNTPHRMYVFSYGSNMSPERLIDRDIEADVIGTGVLSHWRLAFNKKSYKNPDNGFANIEPCWDSFVIGVVIDASDADIEKLDRCEGHPKHYQKTLLPIEIGGSVVFCVTYVANRRWTTSKKLAVEESYRRHIERGLDFLSIDESAKKKYAEEVGLLMD